MVTEVLQKIGFTPNEASVYLALLTLGQATTIETATSANLTRTTTYDVLRSLQRKGVISEVQREKKRLFTIESLDPLQTFLQKQEQQLHQGKEALHNIRIEMENLRYPYKSLPKVRLYEGKEEIHHLLGTLFAQHAQQQYSFVCTDHFITHYGDFLRSTTPLRQEHHIQSNVLIHDSTVTTPTSAFPKDQLTQIRSLEGGQQYDAAMHIIGNHVGFWSAKKDIVVVTMESPEIASLHQQVFTDLWAQALLQ